MTRLRWRVRGWLLKTFPGEAGFTVVYGIAAVTALVGTFLVLYQYEPPSVEQPQGSMLSSYKEILKDRNFMAFVKMVLFFNLALVVAGPFFTVHFIEALKVPIEVLALFTALAAVTGILGNFFFGKMSDILGNRFIIRFSLLMLMIPTGLMLFLPAKNPLPMVAAVILLQSFFGAGWNLTLCVWRWLGQDIPYLFDILPKLGAAQLALGGLDQFQPRLCGSGGGGQWSRRENKAPRAIH